MATEKKAQDDKKAQDTKGKAVQLVIHAEGGVAAAFVDSPEQAAAYAEVAEGVVISLPIDVDHRKQD